MIISKANRAERKCNTSLLIKQAIKATFKMDEWSFTGSREGTLLYRDF